MKLRSTSRNSSANVFQLTSNAMSTAKSPTSVQQQQQRRAAAAAGQSAEEQKELQGLRQRNTDALELAQRVVNTMENVHVAKIDHQEFSSFRGECAGIGGLECVASLAWYCSCSGDPSRVVITRLAASAHGGEAYRIIAVPRCLATYQQQLHWDHIMALGLYRFTGIRHFSASCTVVLLRRQASYSSAHLTL